MNQPPPPRFPHPDEPLLTDEEQEALPPGQLVPITRDILERTIGFQVVNWPGAYLECFTHKSVSNYYKRQSYERLEFLGDSVVNFTTAKYLFDRYPTEDEGFMTKLRTRLTRSETLAFFASKLQLDRFVFMSGKGLYRRWNTNKRILEDCMESLIGAVYLDQGLAQAKNFFIGLIETYIDFDDLLKDRNYKDILMRRQHACGQPLPVYLCETHQNVDENERRSRVFCVSVCIDAHVGYGTGSTKKEAEQLAARDVLLKLEIQLDD